ncbi:NACHT domain-containing protein [Dactylosporangium sp. CA-092794]|uniref:NACHT domain-containing protein n=1 Tax=Dactylosporangium sp. CA-092794 TaxID=3239929 RepID=UPI003D89BA68
MVALVGMLVFLATGAPSWLATADQLGSVAGAVLAAAALVVTVVLGHNAARAAPADLAAIVRDAADGLAGQVARQWYREAQARGLLRPGPIRVRWSSTGRPVAAAPAEVFGSAVGRVTRLRLHGDVTEIADVWQRLPARQLVVIGAPGAGKTSAAVLLVHRLLQRRESGDPVPVLFNLAGWDPTGTHLDTWLAQRLATQYPHLTARAAQGRTTARILVDQTAIVPVLDGLDEMPDALRPAAIAALTNAVGPHQPLVLTCRAQEYQDVIAGSGTPLARAVVVEIEPVTAAQAADYLPTGQVDGHDRWKPVIAHLRAQPDGALAQALATPLMVYLARTVYSPVRADPADLVTVTDANAIQQHLLRAYLPAVYGPGTPIRDDDLPAQRDYAPQQAERWLAFLARHLDQQRTRDLAWWHLVDAIGGHRPAGLRRGVAGFAVGLLTRIAVTALRITDFPGDPASHHRPRRTHLRRGECAAMLTNGIAFGFLIGPKSGLAAGIVAGVGGIFSRKLGFGPAGMASPTELLDPRLAYRRDRTALLTDGLSAGTALGIALGFLVGDQFGFANGLMAALMIGFAAGLLLGLQYAWARLQVARCLLAASGELPWSLMDFLDDAYRRGVLRRVGAEYQFRHARLQDHLATRDVR